MKLEGKVAFITGAGRGQGRSHAVRLAQEGAAIIAVDLCDQMSAVPYPLSTREDLDQTVKEVEAIGGRIVARVADVRDLDALEASLNDGLKEFGRLDIVVANAAVLHQHSKLWEISEPDFQEHLDVNLMGVWRTIKATVPTLIKQGEGGSVHLTASVNGMTASENFGHYVTAKHGVVGLMRSLALELAPYMIRANAICPTNVETPMIMNPWMRDLFAGGRADATEQDIVDALSGVNTMDIPFVQPVDISNAIVYLASDDGRYVTGTTHLVDAGCMLSGG